jgi:serine protease
MNQELGAQITSKLGLGQWWLQLAGGSDANAVEARLRGVPGVQRAWVQSNGLAAAPVAVLDTGVTAHGELQGHLLPGYDLVSDVDMANDGDGRDADPTDPGDWVSASDRANPAFDGCAVADSSWHGTVIAGLIAARTDNNVGVAAVNWHGRIVPVRVAGKCGAQVADIVDGMRWAAGLRVSDGRGGFLPRNANPVRVVNISFGGHAPCNAAYQSAIDELHARGVVVVAAAGNEHGAVLRPASCRGVVAVAGLNRDGFKTHYSSFGPQVTLATVGGDDAGGVWGPLLTDHGLLSIANQGRTTPADAGYARHTGTSFAAPLVAGTLSLMLSVNPTLSANRLVAGLAVSARPHVRSPWIAECSFDNPGRCLCTTATCGAGILDAEQALLYAADPAAYAVPARGAEVLDNDELHQAAALGPDRPGQPAVVPEPTGGGALPWTQLLALVLVRLALRAATRRA